MLRSLRFVILAFAVVALGAAPSPLAPFANALDAVTGYHTTINTFEAKGSETRLSTFDFRFTKSPPSITMGIVKGPNAGATVRWSGGTSVSAGKGMFRKNVALTDSLVTSLRGYTIVDLTFGSILKHAESTPGTLEQRSMQLGSTTVDAITLDVKTPSEDDGMTREVLYLSPATHLPVRIDGFTGSTLVRSYSFESTTLN